MAFNKRTWVNVPDPSNYDGDLNKLPRFDADNMNRIEEGIEEAEKNRQILTYVSFSDVGQTIGEETIDGIVDGMPNNSILYTGISTSNAKIYPNSYGTLKVTKRDSSRVIFEFFNKSTNINYIGSYDNTKTYKWSGWEKVLTTGTASPDDVGAAPSGHGLGDSAIICDNSFSDYFQKGCGFYQMRSSSESPDKSKTWIPVVQIVRAKGEGEETGAQLAFLDVLDNQSEIPRAWFRTVTKGDFSSWFELIHTGNVTNHGVAKIQTRTYTGSGTANSVTLTFDFVPKIVFVQSKAYIREGNMAIMINGVNSMSPFPYAGTMGVGSESVTWSGKSVTFTTNDEDSNINNPEKTYYCVALG